MIAAEDERGIGWARDFFEAAAPFASGGVYVNFLTADEGDRVRARLRPELRAPRRGEAQVRPGQPVPHEPEHQPGVRADFLEENWGTEAHIGRVVLAPSSGPSLPPSRGKPMLKESFRRSLYSTIFCRWPVSDARTIASSIRWRRTA